ncbi:MAG: hypothetical protein ACLP8S_27500 [Solirubrobacteraceae bacterium]
MAAPAAGVDRPVGVRAGDPRHAPRPDAAGRPLVLALHRESALTGFVCLGA